MSTIPLGGKVYCWVLTECMKNWELSREVIIRCVGWNTALLFSLPQLPRVLESRADGVGGRARVTGASPRVCAASVQLVFFPYRLKNCSFI